MVEVRVQAPDGPVTLSLPAGATVADLRAEITRLCAVPVVAQELLSGFPPVPLTAADDTSVAQALGGGARVLVRRAAAAGPSSSSSGGGRRKPQQVRRLPEGSLAPRDVPVQPPVAPPAPLQPGAGADVVVEAAGEGDEGQEASASSHGGGGRKRKAGGPKINPNADPLALTLQSEVARQRAVSGIGDGGSSGREPTSKAPRIKAQTVEQLASDYYTSSGSAISAAARGGGKTGDFLSEHGAIEHRVSALTTRKYELTAQPAQGKGCGQLVASFKAVRKQLVETVQHLSRDELRGFLRALSSRGSSSRGNTTSHLLTAHAMASRSFALLGSHLPDPLLSFCDKHRLCCDTHRPAVFWSMAHEFDGHIEAGVVALRAEL